MPTLRRLMQGDPCKFKASQVYQRRNMANQDAVIKPRRKLGFKKTFKSSHWSSLSLGRLRAGVYHELSSERRRKISVIIIMMK